MAKGPKYGQEVKLTGFTRGGTPVGKRTGASSKTVVTPKRDGYSKREIAALIGAGALTAGAGGLMIGALRQKGTR
jgi:hypothetical protein